MDREKPRETISQKKKGPIVESSLSLCGVKYDSLTYVWRTCVSETLKRAAASKLFFYGNSSSKYPEINIYYGFKHRESQLVQ